MGINVLSLFDGMSCGQIALNKLNISVDNYFACEIKKIAIKVTRQNFPNTIFLGDVLSLDKSSNLPKIDLLIGGSPCQDFTTLKKDRKNLEGDKSKLFYEYLRILKFIKPKYFLLENVTMNKYSEQQLNEYLGVKGIHINSKLVSFQNRPRIYWTNIPNVVPPMDRHINFQDFKDQDYNYCKQFKVNQTSSRLKMWNNGMGRNNVKDGCKNITNSVKIQTISRKQDRCPNSGLIQFEDFCRFLTRRELELGQTVPIGYTSCLSYNQAQDVLGDGWTVDVIAHILKNII